MALAVYINIYVFIKVNLLYRNRQVIGVYLSLLVTRDEGTTTKTLPIEVAIVATIDFLLVAGSALFMLVAGIRFYFFLRKQNQSLFKAAVGKVRNVTIL